MEWKRGHNIKLVACDMDGTLLDDDKKLDPSIFELVQEMKARGIYFAVASGRQLASLSRIFEAVAEDIFFIAENGAVVTYGNKEMAYTSMEKILVQQILQELKKIPDTDVTLCGKDTIFTTDRENHDKMRSGKFMYNSSLVKALEEVDNEILKVTLIDMGYGMEKANALAQELLKDIADVATSGFNCIDIMPKNVNKGQALSVIQKKLAIAPMETVVFGDNYNDVEMFSKAHYSYAMKNAEEGVKGQARYITEYTNNENAVLKELKKLLFAE